MSKRIDDLPEDLSVNLADTLVGTNAADGVSYKYKIQEITDIIAAKVGSSVTTDNIRTITETAPNNWIDVLNILNPIWTINPADIAFVERYDQTAVYIGTYLYVKSSIVTDRIGIGETAVSSADFMEIRLANDIGEANTMSSLGGTSLVGTKAGVVLPIKGLTAGTNMSLVASGTAVTINMTGTLGEINTLGDDATGTGVSLVSAKSALELKVKTLTATGAGVAIATGDVNIDVWGKVVESASFNVSSATHERRTVYIKNAAANIIVTVPDSLSADFECAFIQYGTGTVTFTVSGAATINESELTLKGQWAHAYLATDPANATVFDLVGETKV